MYRNILSYKVETKAILKNFKFYNMVLLEKNIKNYIEIKLKIQYYTLNDISSTGVM